MKKKCDGLLRFNDFSKTFKSVGLDVIKEDYSADYRDNFKRNQKEKFDKMFKMINDYFNSEQSSQSRIYLSSILTLYIDPHSREDSKLKAFNNFIELVKKDLNID